MICRNCGTEIADKAIVCYRCGAGTTDPVRQPAVIKRRRGRLLPLVALVLLVLLALYLGQAGRVAPVPLSGSYNIAAGICVGIAIVLVMVRISRRR
jgi:zinc ribbon protein